MIVERVARAMTEGALRAGFTARVMAPIHGRPRPGFTARVMAGLDAPRPHADGRALRPVLIASGVMAFAASAALWLPAGLSLPPAPDAPRIAARPYDRELIGIPPLPYNRWAPETPAPVTQRAAAAAPSGTPAVAAEQPGAAAPDTMYRIAALAPLPEIAFSSLDAAPAPIAALQAPAPLPGPAPLTLPTLKLEKETP